MSSNSENATFYVSSMQNKPYSFGLWDMTGNVGTRAWYLRDANGKWVWFSDERGPICHIWRSGAQAIKLVHNGNQNDSEIFEFNINLRYSSYI